MDYTVEEIDIRDAANLSQIRSLLSETFGADVSENKLELSTTTNSPKPSLYVAAIHDDEVIGFNAFISHDMVADGQPINCYQSCWTATSPAHRGKGRAARAASWASTSRRLGDSRSEPVRGSAGEGDNWGARAVAVNA